MKKLFGLILSGTLLTSEAYASDSYDPGVSTSSQQAGSLNANTAIILAAASTATAAPSSLAPSSSPILVQGRTRVNSPMPLQMTAAERAAYRQIFSAIREGRFSAAAASLNTMSSNGLLTATAWAELWLAAGSPRPASDALAAWVSQHGDLPQAARVQGLARRDGLSNFAALPQATGLRPIYNSSSRSRPRSTSGSAATTAFISQVRPLLAADRSSDAQDLLERSSIDHDSRVEWSQRIAWSHYLDGNDTAALALASRVAHNNDQWGTLANWVSGLASFRTGNYQAAAGYFGKVASNARNSSLAAAGNFWAARAEMALGRPEQVSPRLRTAARYGDVFYGLLASRVLGIEPPEKTAKPDFLLADWKHVENLPGARRAAALSEIGELGLADRELRHLAMTGLAENHVPLTYLAAKLNLPATQYWLANNAPVGITPPMSARYPAPEWLPARGWRVDRSLVYAHALQESRFITDARSHAGARGIMQLMPGTARELARNMPIGSSDKELTDPSFNIEFGQTYLEELRDSRWTNGLLPKVIAAYNAGPGSVMKWNTSLKDNNDPLLFIESIPFIETRHYVEIVLRNYWMYQQGDGAETPSLDALAQGMWPRFPGMANPAIRMNNLTEASSIKQNAK